MPLRRAVHEEVRFVLANTVGFWRNAYLQAVPEKLPLKTKTLVSEEVIHKIGCYLTMDVPANVFPARPWWDYVPQEIGRNKDALKTILNRYGNVLEPEIFSKLHRMESSLFDPGFVATMRGTAPSLGPRCYPLNRYFLISEDYFEVLPVLMDWCNRERIVLELELGIKIIPLEVDEPNVPANLNPPAMIDIKVFGELTAEILTEVKKKGIRKFKKNGSV
jgi:hypothetical protein